MIHWSRDEISQLSSAFGEMDSLLLDLRSSGGRHTRAQIIDLQRRLESLAQSINVEFGRAEDYEDMNDVSG